MLPLFLSKVLIPEHKAFRDQAYWDCREQIHCRVLLEKHGGQTIMTAKTTRIVGTSGSFSTPSAWAWG